MMLNSSFSRAMMTFSRFQQMHLVKVQGNNFHRVAAVQDDSCFKSLFDVKMGEFPGKQQLKDEPEM